MKNCFFLSTTDICGSYMSIFEKDYAKYEDLHKWTKFVEHKLKEKFKGVTVYNKFCVREQDELTDAEVNKRCEYFRFLKEGVTLADGKTIEDITKDVTAPIEYEVLLTMCESSQEYQNRLIKEQGIINTL